MKFVFNCKALVAPSDTTGSQVCNIDPNDANTYFLTPGRYTVKDTGLWCEPAFVKADLTISSYGAPVWVC